MNILVPTDTSDLSHVAAQHGMELARRLGGTPTLLFVQGEMTPTLPMQQLEVYLPPVSVEDLRREADEVTASLQRRYPEAQVRVRRGEVTGVILDAARDLDAHLIVMGTHGRGGISRALLGSVAEGVVRRSPVPVLLVREGHTPPTGE